MSGLIENIKSLFIKEETFSCIVFDGVKMSYVNLTQKQIDNIENSPNHEGWSVTKQEEIQN